MIKSIAQHGSINGQVIDNETGQPVEFAHVFIGNTTYGVTTDENGNFTLEKVPAGEFDLVTSFVGYNLYVKKFQIAPNQTTTALIRLKPKLLELKEVEVTGKQDRYWKRQLKKFTSEFLGDGPNARQCTIVNPWVIDFHKDNATGMNIASAEDPIEVINEALGYKIFYYLEHFMWRSGYISYFGYPRFEVLEADTKQKEEEWESNRKISYEGSMRHLFFSIINNRVEEEGFKIYQYSQGVEGQSINYRIIANLEDLIGNQFLEFDPGKVIRPTIGSDIVLINFYGALEVIYKKINWEYSPYPDAPYQVSTIKFLRPVRCAKHGYVFDQLNYEVSGYYILVRLANLLPFEYGTDR